MHSETTIGRHSERQASTGRHSETSTNTATQAQAQQHRHRHSDIGTGTARQAHRSPTRNQACTEAARHANTTCSHCTVCFNLRPPLAATLHAIPGHLRYPVPDGASGILELQLGPHRSPHRGKPSRAAGSRTSGVRAGCGSGWCGAAGGQYRPARPPRAARAAGSPHPSPHTDSVRTPGWVVVFKKGLVVLHKLPQKCSARQSLGAIVFEPT